MRRFFNRFKIPTLFGLSLIFIGLASGLYLVFREQVFLSQAAPDLTPQNIAITNITDESVVISWQTNVVATSFITYGQNNPEEQTAKDDRDNQTPKPHLIHYVTLKNLLPNTHYFYKIKSGKLISEAMEFETASPLGNQTGFTPIIGSVLDGNNSLNDGVVYLSIPDAVTQSALIKTGGNFLVPISQIRTKDLTNIFPLTEETTAKLVVRSDKGNASTLFKLQTSVSPLPIIKLGQDTDLTVLTQIPILLPTVKDLDQYDLNNDGKINAADYAIQASCFDNRTNTRTKTEEKQSCAKTDTNGDGEINQQDLDLMSRKIEELGSQ